MNQKAVKADAVFLDLARAELIRKCRERLEPILRDNLVTGFREPGFVARFGVSLERISEREIVDTALWALIEKIQNAPDGKTGIPMIDEFPETEPGSSEHYPHPEGSE